MWQMRQNLSNKQLQILAFASLNKNQITKKQPVELLEHYYFLNAQKYVGEVLSRMVNTGLLKRIKNGLFEISGDRKQTVKGIPNPDQLELL